MKIVVGLGNPGNEYAYTHHNMGFLAAECLADRLGFAFKKKECDSLTARGRCGDVDLVIAKPQTYMNLSGTAVKQLLRRYRAELGDLIVIYDDIDLERGTLRVRRKGSAGTHNGMRNIIEQLGSGDFARIRVGIGRPPQFVDLADFVLSEVPRSERADFAKLLESAADEAVKLINE